MTISETRGSPDHTEASEQAPTLTCRACGADLEADEKYSRFGVCSNCGRHHRISASQRIELITDPGTFEEFSGNLVSKDPLTFSDRLPYRRRVLQAREETGMSEAAVTGIARIRGHEVILVVLDFHFLGGSMGSVVGEKVATAFERAIEKRVPIITISASGGARMQEGMLSLVQMAKTAAAAKRVHDSHIPYISILTHPTT
jgi:acetyl-CoA carboxylase carboxyl transferase subunit beta